MFLRNRLTRRRQLLLLLPIVVPFLLLFVYGLYYALLQSFGLKTPVDSIYRGFDSYKILFRDPWFISSYLLSIKVALLSAIISIILGCLLSYWLWLQPVESSKYTIVYKIPLILPHIVAALFIQLFFSKTGLISTIFFKLGLIDNLSSFPQLIYSESGIGIILAYIYKEVPFVILLKLAIYERIDKKLLIAAKNLGASTTVIFVKIILPYLLPVINTLFVILFLYSFGAYEIPFILGSSRPEMLPIYIYKLYFEKGLSYRPVAMAALILIFLFSSIFVYIYSQISRKVFNGARTL